MQNIIDAIKAKNSDTFQFYSKDGVFTDAREKLHDAIVEKIIARGVYNPRKTVYMLGGATANGKSTLINSGMLPHPPGDSAVSDHSISLLIDHPKLYA